jgi:quercetin dioxygenase-like cupin family protein
MLPIVSLRKQSDVITKESQHEVMDRVSSQETDGVFRISERILSPHSIAAEPRVDKKSAETLYVLEGNPTIFSGDSSAQYNPGTIVYIPKNTLYGYTNPTETTVRVLCISTPLIGNNEGLGESIGLKHDSAIPDAVVVSREGEGIVFPMEPGSLVRFKVLSRQTSDVIEMYERELPPHTIGADPHLHKTTTETFYVIEGRPTILCGEASSEYGPGDVIVVPPNTVHAYFNHSDTPVKVLIWFTPGLGHDEFFRELSKLKHGPPNTYQRDLNSLRERFDSISVSLD